MHPSHLLFPPGPPEPAISVFFACLLILIPLSSLLCAPPPPPLTKSGRWGIKCWEVLSSGHQTDASWLSHSHRLQIAALHHENRAAVHKTFVGGRRMESGIRPVTEECNQRAFYYVSQRGHGTLQPLPHTSFHSVIVWVMHACFDFEVCMCLDECVRIPLICEMSVVHACMLLNVFQ